MTRICMASFIGNPETWVKSISRALMDHVITPGLARKTIPPDAEAMVEAAIEGMGDAISINQAESGHVAEALRDGFVRHGPIIHVLDVEELLGPDEARIFEERLVSELASLAIKMEDEWKARSQTNVVPLWAPRENESDENDHMLE